MKILQISILIILTLNSCLNKESTNTKIQESVLPIEVKSKSTDDSQIEIKEAENHEAKILDFKSNFSFDKYAVEIFNGKLSNPNFKGNPFAEDKEYVKFISDGCDKNGINFGGKYTIFTRGCGMECSHLFIVDRMNGEIFTEINLNEGRYGYKFRPNSTMLIANSDLFTDDEFKNYVEHYHWKPELYNWEKNEFKRIK